MAKKTNQRRDFTQIAFSVFKKAIGEGESDEGDPKEKAVRAAKRRGGIAGAKARAKVLTKEQRADIARLAAVARWKKGN